MKIEEILNLTRREALTKYVEDLDKAYFELSGRHFCRFCQADISTMFNELKTKYMSNTNEFRLVRERASYRVKKGVYISNDKMTDELAIEWLRDCPERIKFFSSFPENWKEMLSPAEVSEEAPQASNEQIEEEQFRGNLELLKLSELKEIYPEISVEFGQKKSDFIDKIVESNK